MDNYSLSFNVRLLTIYTCPYLPLNLCIIATFRIWVKYNNLTNRICRIYKQYSTCIYRAYNSLGIDFRLKLSNVITLRVTGKVLLIFVNSYFYNRPSPIIQIQFRDGDGAFAFVLCVLVILKQFSFLFWQV